MSSLELAQTHVLPAGGLSWTLSAANESYHAIGGRAALAVLRLSAANGANIRLEGWANNVSLGMTSVSAPSSLLPTEANGPSYAGDAYSAEIPASWMVPNLQLRVLADNYLPGAWKPALIGADSQAVLRILPFYVYGANPANSFPLSTTGLPNQATVDEIYAKWPVASLTVQSHGAQAVVWPTMVIGPREGHAAYLADSKDDQLDGYATMSAVLQVMGGLINANGERPAPVQYYAPLIMFNAAGTYEHPGGGLGGGEVGTGDYGYRGIFIHEQGHAMGLPHQGEAYADGKYPYVAGSLAGSVWGYDQVGRRFLGPFVPTSASRYARCRGDSFAGTPRQLDSEGRCVKQDPMQSGAGDEAAGYKFATFSDYSTAMYQRYFEGRTTVGSGGAHSYSGGSVIEDAAYPGGYRRWDSIDQRWVNVDAVTTSGGISGLDGNLPQQRNLPVHAIVLTYSYAGTPQVSQFYPILSFTGNLLRYIDPTDPAHRASIVPNSGLNYWYCRNGGCDYTIRVTYADGSQRHVLIQGGFRPFNQDSGMPPPSASDPLNGASFKTWVVNVPATQAVRKLELLDTPKVWEGMPVAPAVLVTKDFPIPLLPQFDHSSQCVELPTLTAPSIVPVLSSCQAAAASLPAETLKLQQKLKSAIRGSVRR
ncbi:peptidase M66 family protein [Lysobacter capsici]|nr:peptidase M66 family protein [Lysobacter capsici]